MKAVILGSGKCARDIGAYLLTRGHAVTWLSHSAERLESLRAQTGRVVRRLAGKGPAPDASFHIYGSAVGPPAEILIEATVEGAGEKRNAFGAARALCAPSTLLWTNSSSILARDIAGDAINVHFFYPLELARLAEVIRFGPDGPHDRTVALLHDLDIKVIEQTEGNAFAVNRLLLPCQNELFRLLMRGQSASALDAASAAGIFPAGLLALMDGVGLDVIAAGARNYCGRMRPDERAEFAPLLDGLTALTSLGKAGSKNRNGLLCGDPLRWPASGAAIDERALTRRFAALFLNTCLRFIERGEILGPDCDLALDRALGSESSLLDAVRRLGRDAMVKDLRDGRDETGCRYFEPSTLIDPYCERPPAVVAAVMQSIANATLLPYEEALREETRIFLGAAQPTTEQRDAGASRGFVAVTGKRSEVSREVLDFPQSFPRIRAGLQETDSE